MEILSFIRSFDWSDRNARIMLKYSASKKSWRWIVLVLLLLGHINSTGHGGSFIVRSWRTVLVYVFFMCIQCFVIWILLCARVLCTVMHIISFFVPWGKTRLHGWIIFFRCFSFTLLISMEVLVRVYYFQVIFISLHFFFLCILTSFGISLSSHHIFEQFSWYFISFCFVHLYWANVFLDHRHH